ncbi:hypothetical protein K501DRAFT_225072 [Backusella circina FSU 941]|nr:hypothetical protein K501DRAFT_225072 [Backusella circina FSU 941]
MFVTALAGNEMDSLISPIPLNMYRDVSPKEEITTIFVAGFPEDMQEREFQNMFMFCSGFEAAALKLPSSDDELDTSGRKQIIGFAKFFSRREALEALETLNGRRVDAEKGSILKAEMAKKNLYTKRGLLNEHTKLSSYDAFHSIELHSPTESFSDFYNKMSMPDSTSIARSQSMDGRPDLFIKPSLSSYRFNPNKRTPPTSFSEGLDYLSKSTPTNDGFQISSIFGSSNSNTISSTISSARTISPPPSISTGLSRLNEESYYHDPARFHPLATSPTLSTPPSILSPTHSYRSLGGMLSGSTNPADQNPPCNTLYVGNLPPDTSEEELRILFSRTLGYKRLLFRNKSNGPMCFVEFEDTGYASQTLQDLQGHPLSNSIKGGIRLSFSKNPLGVRQGNNSNN